VLSTLRYFRSEYMDKLRKRPQAAGMKNGASAGS
jgi:hypothetical protein